MPSGRLFLAVCFAGLVALAIVAVTQRTRDAFSLGVPAGGVAAELQPGQRACQSPVAIPDADATFERVVVALGTYRRPGSPLEVTLAPAGGGKPLARGRLRGGYPDVDRAPTHTINVGPVTTRASLRVCLRNAGEHRLAVYGNGGAASRTSSATLDDKPIDVDLSLSFERGRPRSLASLVPVMFKRASLFRAGFVGPWTMWLVALVVLLGSPLLITAALRAAGRDDQLSG
jgi:hypothetical protein